MNILGLVIGWTLILTFYWEKKKVFHCDYFFPRIHQWSQGSLAGNMLKPFKADDWSIFKGNVYILNGGRRDFWYDSGEMLSLRHISYLDLEVSMFHTWCLCWFTQSWKKFLSDFFPEGISNTESIQTYCKHAFQLGGSNEPERLETSVMVLLTISWTFPQAF